MTLPAPIDHGALDDLSGDERAIVLLAHGRQWLEAAQAERDVVGLDEFRRRADAIATYQRSVVDGARAAAAANELRVRAERAIGTLIAEQEKHPGSAQPGVGRRGNVDAACHRIPTLADQGITKDQSRRYQQLAAVPEPEFEKAIEDERAAEKIPTRAGILRRAGVTPPEDEIRDRHAAHDRLHRFLDAIDVIKAEGVDAGLVVQDAPLDVRQFLLACHRHAAQAAIDALSNFLAALDEHAPLRRIK